MTARRRRPTAITHSRQFLPVTVRGLARSAALTAITAVERLRGGLEAPLATPRVQLIVLHHLFPDEVPRFRELLRVLARQHRFVSYSAAVDLIAAGGVDRPTVAFSYDDGRACCIEAGRILADHGASACFFVCPSVLTHSDPEWLRRFHLERLCMPEVPLADWDDLETLRDLGHEIGNHTWRHLDLAQCSTAELEEEVCRARDELVRRLGGVEHFAWPYGGFPWFSPQAAALVFASGHRSCASGVRGCHRGPGVARPCLRRDNVIVAAPLAHTLHFLARNARAPMGRDGAWPEGWATAIEAVPPCAS